MIESKKLKIDFLILFFVTSSIIGLYVSGTFSVKNKIKECTEGVFTLEYREKIKKDMSVNIILLCKESILTVSGSVEQTFTKDMFNKISNLPYSVNLDQDYNFDGYNDLTVIGSREETGEEMNSYFLFDPTTKVFVYDSNLNNLENISIIMDTSKKMISESNILFLDEDKNINQYNFYSWYNKALVLNSSLIVAYDKNSNELWRSKTVFQNGLSDVRSRLAQALKLKGGEDVRFDSIEQNGYHFSIVKEPNDSNEIERYIVDFISKSVIKI